MAVDASPYATLGLEPGADWATIERTYRDLIKRHHPDRAGGDAARAAEITRAYRELKRERVDGKALVLAEDPFHIEPRRRGWLGAALVGGGAVVLVLTASGPLTALFNQPRHPSDSRTD